MGSLSLPKRYRQAGGRGPILLLEEHGQSRHSDGSPLEGYDPPDVEGLGLHPCCRRLGGHHVPRRADVDGHSGL